MSPHERTKSRPEVDFQAELNSIINKPLSVEIVDTYADQALEDLIGLAERLIAAYGTVSTLSYDSKNDMEQAAFEHYGLGDIEAILDHLQAKATELQNLDAFIARLTNDNRVIIPPDNLSGMSIKPGENTTFEAKRTFQRLKSLLFILSNEFGIDVEDESQARIIPGKVKPNMIRRASYYLVEVPSLAKSVLVCDEEGNASYVFNNEPISVLDIIPDDLAEYSKPELNTLLELDPQMGQRIRYSDYFVPNVLAALKKQPGETDETSEIVTGTTEDTGKYLVPVAPPEVLSRKGLETLFGLHKGPIDAAITALGESLGTINIYRFKRWHVEGFTVRQQELIQEYLETTNHLNAPPDGFLHQYGIARVLGVNHHLIGKVTKLLEAEGSLGATAQYKSAARVTVYYSPAQQDLILERLIEIGTFADLAPDSYLNEYGISQRLGINNEAVGRIVDELGTSLGETHRYKSSLNHQATIYFSPEQQDLIYEYAESSGLLEDMAPEGTVSYTALAKKLGVGERTVASALAALGDKLGEVRQYKFWSTRTDGYTIEQQELVRQYLEENDYLVSTVPEGYLSLRGLRALLKVSGSTIERTLTLEGVADQLGEVNMYKFGSRTYPAYSPSQQELIRQNLDRAGFYDNVPDELLSAIGISTLLGISPTKVYRIAAEIENQLGELYSYKRGARSIILYSPEQQSLIRRQAESEGLLTEPAPEGVLPINGLRKVLGRNTDTIQAIIDRLGEEFGETRTYKFGSKVTRGFTPEQQSLIAEFILRDSRADSSH